MNEPLSALDLKLRQKVRLELKELQRETGITFIFVTHDQEEALTMSDRIAIMSEGSLQQFGTPSDVCDLPANRFVAEFIGDTNLLDVDLNDGHAVLPGGARIKLLGNTKAASGTISIRPEYLRLVTNGDGQISGRVADQVFLGTDIQTVLNLEDGTEITARVPRRDAGILPKIGECAHLTLEVAQERLLVD